MQRTGRRLLVLKAISYLPFFLLFFNGLAYAQSVSVTATLSETAIYTGEQVTLTVEVSGKRFKKISPPSLPNLQGMEYLSKTPSTSTSYSFINGTTSQSYDYSYYLQAKKKGKFTIPPITVTVDGKGYSTQPIHVTIINRNKAAKSSNSNGLPDIFLRMRVSDHHPVNGQQIVASLVLYFKNSLQVSSYQAMSGWKADGFWKEELDENQQPRAVSTIIDGERFNKAVLIKYALFPTKEGKLTLSPFQVQCVVSYKSNYNDPFSSFFGGFGTSQRNVNLQSDPVTVDVRPLPPRPIGAKYVDAVGQFNVTRSISQNSVKLGNSIELTTTFKGTGNIALISKPHFDLPGSFEAYQPQQSQKINRNGDLVNGSKTFTDILVARKLGKFKIPATRLAFYNNNTHKYVFNKLPAITISVIPNPNENNTVSSNSSFNLTPVTGLVSWTTAGYRPIFRLWWFWLGIIIPLLVIGVGYWQKNYRDRMQNDSKFARSHTAFDKTKALLAKASEFSKSNDMKSAYSYLHQSLSGYIGDKLNLPLAGLSDEQYIEHLRNNKVDEVIITKIKRILLKCSTIRFAPLTSQEDFKRDLKITEEILSELRRVL